MTLHDEWEASRKAADKIKNDTDRFLARETSAVVAGVLDEKRKILSDMGGINTYAGALPHHTGLNNQVRVSSYSMGRQITVQFYCPDGVVYSSMARAGNWLVNRADQIVEVFNASPAITTMHLVGVDANLLPVAVREREFTLRITFVPRTGSVPEGYEELIKGLSK